MRRYMASLAVLTFLLFALGVMAQTSGSYGQSNPPSASSSSSENQQNSTTTTTTTSQTTTGSQQASNLDGCIVREQADYFLVPRSGSPIKLQSASGQDFSSKVGQHVQVTGNESSLSASAGTGTSGMSGTSSGGYGTSGQTGTGTSSAAPSTSASAGTSGGMAGATAGTSGTSGQTGATGAIGAPSSTSGTGSSGMATSSDLHSMANQQLDVNKISAVGSCPPNWNPNVPQTSTSSPSQTR